MILCVRICGTVLDGIGKAMAFGLAKKGLNVLLISRTESKLVDTEAELKGKCPGVTVEHLAIDYSSFDATAQVSTLLANAVLMLACLGARVHPSAPIRVASLALALRIP